MSAGLNPTSDNLRAIENAVLQLLAAVQQARNVPNPAPPPVTQTAPTPLSVVDLFNDFLLAKARAGRSDNYTGLLLKELRSFSIGRESRPVASITAQEIETWLNAQGWSQRTKKGRLLTLRTVFSWGAARGLLLGNPALGVDTPQDESEQAPPGIHTVEQVQAVLDCARKHDLDVMRCLAIRYFAGLRTSEAVRLEEKEIGEKFIEVTALKSKTRRRRLVEIQPNLAAWLAIGGTLPLKQVSEPACGNNETVGRPVAQKRCPSFLCQLPPCEIPKRRKNRPCRRSQRSHAFWSLSGNCHPGPRQGLFQHTARKSRAR